MRRAILRLVPRGHARGHARGVWHCTPRRGISSSSHVMTAQVVQPDSLASASEASNLAVGAAEMGYWPPELALRLVGLVHDVAEVPWWGAILGTTLLLRFSLLPLSLQATMMAARLQGLRGQIAALQAKHAGPTPDPAAMAVELQALYAQHNASPLQTVIPALLQAPVFMSVFLGLRRLADTFPDAHTGGLLWFTDLGVRDSTYIMPAVSSVSALALVWLSIRPPAGASAEEVKQQGRIKLLFVGITALSMPIACTMPASVLVFWGSNNAFSLAYTTLVNHVPAVRRVLQLDPPATQNNATALALSGGTAAPGLATGTVSTLLDGSVTQPPIGAAQLHDAKFQTAETLSALAVSLHASGKHADAAAMAHRSYVLAESVLGDADARTRRLLWSAAELQHDAGNHEKALLAYRKWLSTRSDLAAAAADTIDAADLGGMATRAAAAKIVELEALVPQSTHRLQATIRVSSVDEQPPRVGSPRE